MPDQETLTVAQRFARVEREFKYVAWDGCHKLYFLTDPEHDLVQAEEYGYTVYPAAEATNLFNQSCALRFLSKWGGDTNESFGHHWNVRQFEPEDEHQGRTGEEAEFLIDLAREEPHA